MESHFGHWCLGQSHNLKKLFLFQSWNPGMSVVNYKEQDKKEESNWHHQNGAYSRNHNLL